MYLVLFDCDGTLVDSQDTIVSGLETAFAAVGLPVPPRADCLSIVGLSLEIAIARLVDPAHHHLVPAMATAYRDAKRAERAAGQGHDPLYPGAREAIEALSRRDDVLLGVATGKALRGVRHMIDMHGLHDRFVTMQTADTAPSKPHPGMILQALQETGVEADRAVMIGDTSYDIEMARAAGVAGVGVAWGYHASGLLHQAGARTVIERFADLAPWLVRHFGWREEVSA